MGYSDSAIGGNDNSYLGLFMLTLATLLSYGVKLGWKGQMADVG